MPEYSKNDMEKEIMNNMRYEMSKELGFNDDEEELGSCERCIKNKKGILDVSENHRNAHCKYKKKNN